MFRNDAQNALACRTLLAQAQLERLWTLEGPTYEALKLLDADGRGLSNGERIVLLAAFAFWNGRSGLKLSEILDTLNPELTEAITSLVVAVKLGPSAVDGWLEIYNG